MHIRHKAIKNCDVGHIVLNLLAQPCHLELASITRALYETRGIEPPFDKLPSKAEFEALNAKITSAHWELTKGWYVLQVVGLNEGMDVQ